MAATRTLLTKKKPRRNHSALDGVIMTQEPHGLNVLAQ